MSRVTIVAREQSFALVLGVADGIMTALTLAGGRLVSRGHALDLALAIRVALAGAVSGGFVFFVAQYAHLRGELVHAEAHLNLRHRGRFATSRLGKDVARESIGGAVIATVTGFVGAMLPLSLGAIFSVFPWVTFLVASVVLAIVGAAIARAVDGDTSRWIVGLVISGAALTCVGVALHIV